MRPSVENLPVAGVPYQIGVVVPGLEAGMAAYESLFGLGPWLRMDTDYVGRNRAWEGRIANRNAFATWGSMHLEMIEPGEGLSVAKEWLETRGQGIFHVAVAVEDVPAAAGDLEVVYEVASKPQPDGRAGIVFVDTLGSLGYYLELVYSPFADDLMRRVGAAV